MPGSSHRASARTSTRGALAQQRELGTPEEIIDLIVQTSDRVRRGEADAFVARRQLLQEVEAAGGGPDAFRFAFSALTLWGGQPPEKWTEILPRVVHVH